MSENKMMLRKEQEQEAADFLAKFAETDIQEQRDALAFIRGVQFGKALSKSAMASEEKGA